MTTAWAVTFGTERRGLGRATARPGPLAVYHPSTASVLITVLLYDGPLLCGCNVPIKRTFVWLVKSILMRERLNSFCIFQLLKL